MGAIKKDPKLLLRVFETQSPLTQTNHDKKVILELQKKLSDLLQDSKNARKAAIILEHWLNGRRKKK